MCSLLREILNGEGQPNDRKYTGSEVLLARIKVVIDTTENCQVMEQIIEDLIAKIGKPTKIAAMIYTHFHTDHTAGGGAVLRLASEIKERSKMYNFYQVSSDVKFAC